jgi:3-methyladenine DNA glycosylase/8-oxoguanine DNA glycosylase
MDERDRKALALLRRDPRMRRLVGKVGPPRFHEYSRADLLHNLVEAVVAQQLSGKVATVIFTRLKALCPRRFPEPSRILMLTEEELRGAGLSRAKIVCIRDLCDAVLSERLDLKALETLSDEEVEEVLVQVKGIGPWTAHMALIFALGRADVWPAADLGLRNALKDVLGLRAAPTPKEAEPMGDPWRPYRSYACWYLWQHHDQ